MTFYLAVHDFVSSLIVIFVSIATLISMDYTHDEGPSSEIAFSKAIFIWK